jgi:myo-inositol-1(or 4)-monophosphatase
VTGGRPARCAATTTVFTNLVDLQDVHEETERVAVAAAEAGAAELRRRYRAGDDDGDYGAHDVKAAADEAAEARMLPVVRRAFPDHAVFAEEAGTFDGDDYRWIIDPLDGTNNFAAGIPAFASSVAVEDEEGPLLAAVVLPTTGERYVARRGEGVRYEGEPVDADSDLATSAATATLVVGREVPRDEELAARYHALRDALAGQFKRVVDSWAPTVHSGLFARGRIQVLVQFHPDDEEQAVTELLAAEAGAATRREGPLYVAASDEARLEEVWHDLVEVV